MLRIANHDTTALVLTGLKAMDATSITLAGIVGMTHEFGTDGDMGAAVNARSANNVHLQEQILMLLEA